MTMRLYFWRKVMAMAYWIDLQFVKLHTHAFTQASRLERKNHG
jgi:hypothetical protein